MGTGDKRPTHSVLAIVSAGTALLFFLIADPFLAPPDCASYWAWGHALFSQLDMDFREAYALTEMPARYVYLTGTDRLSNDWPPGSGWALGPMVLLPRILAHGWVLLLMVLPVLLWWRIAGGDRAPRIAGLIALIAGTPWLFYGFSGPFFSHGVSFAVCSAFLLLWMMVQRSAEDPTRGRHAWLLLGLLLGFAAMVRPQNVLLAVVFLPQIFHRERAFFAEPRSLVLGAGGALLAVTPLLLSWWALYGSPFALPKAEELRWLSPAIGELLFSDFHGLLPWTPVYALAVVGLLVLLRREPVIAAGLLLAFFLQVYVNAANLVWWGGGSFGNRRLLDSAIIVPIGVAALFRCSEDRRLRIAILMAVVLCALWTMWLLLAERRLIVPLDRYIPLNGETIRAMLSVFTDPVATAKSLVRFESGEVPLRLLTSALLGGGVFLVGRAILAARWRHLRAVALATGVVCMVLCMLVAVAAARTPRITDSVLRGHLGTRSTILWDNHVELTYYHLVRQRWPEAEESARASIAEWPEHHTPWYYLAIALHRQGRIPEALDAVNETLRLNPQHAGAQQLGQSIVRERGTPR